MFARFFHNTFPPLFTHPIHALASYHYPLWWSWAWFPFCALLLACLSSCRHSFLVPWVLLPQEQRKPRQKFATSLIMAALHQRQLIIVLLSLQPGQLVLTVEKVLLIPSVFEKSYLHVKVYIPSGKYGLGTWITLTGGSAISINLEGIIYRTG